MRLIDVNNLLALVKKNAPFIYSILAPISLLCPTIDAVPVVRCKDCKHRNEYYSCSGRRDDWFCPNGERRNENGISDYQEPEVRK